MQPPKIILSKLETAERQLDTAIWLWFHEGEVVSITQLVDAAMGVLDDLLFHHKRDRPIPFKPELMQGLKPNEVRPAMTSAADFAKHARKDPEEAYEYNPGFPEHYIFCTILARTALLGEDDDTYSGLRGAFTLWYGVFHPENFDHRSSAFQRARELIDADSLKKLSRGEFLRKMAPMFVGNPPRPDAP